MIKRKKTRAVYVRGVKIGDYAPIVIQSMTNAKTTDIEAVLQQIEELTKVGCQIVRIAIPDQKAVEAFKKIRAQTNTPLVADIHFDYRLAISSIEAGADKVRINPGNIGDKERVKKVIDAAKAAKIPLRIGVNSGSLEKELLKKYGSPVPQALCESALNYLKMMDSFGFYDIVVSIKSSDVISTIEACRLLAENSDVPQHIGITESGTIRSGTIRSAVGIGTLLAEGIGDTIRVSLSGTPIKEIYVAKEILKSLKLMDGPVVIACPTCGRTEINVEEIACKVEEMVSDLQENITIAVMGCVVNGPGEAREADIGIAGGKGEGLLFLKGKPIKKVPEKDLLSELEKEIKKKQDLIPSNHSFKKD
ncbi:MAG: flavodoxin-dependent (E)-4-hydroxy-3-methylbut-2-enyl-diphosphate synthase [Chitinispirillaceae bacterium]|nr:flavodoxin-dependent (E)-4-hydroxy-3-methylbut-2-enyl-diphosphate synthase [Chitinispirillaceae bacterium]